MNGMDYRKFLDAVDVVCMNCVAGEDQCDSCAVHKTCSALNERQKMQKIQIVPGRTYEFYTTDSELRRFNGTRVKVLRELTEEECDISEVGRMYKAEFVVDGDFDVFEDELKEVDV